MSERAAYSFPYTPLLRSDSNQSLEGSENNLSDILTKSSNSCPTCGAEALQSKHDGHTPTAATSNTFSTRAAIVICLLCTSFNCLLVLFSRRGNNGPECSNPDYHTIPDRITRAEYTTLRRPSPFVGMADITRPVPPMPRSIINHPQAIALVDAERPGLVFDDDPLRYMSHSGTVSPEERKVHVTKSISTIVQFRAIDFGMEICELKLRIPFQGNSSFADVDEDSSPLLAEPSMLSIHRLENEAPLDTKILSHKTRPRRVSDIANIAISSAQPNINWSRNFTCEWDLLMIFEIACFDRSGYSEGEGCNLEWWQGKESDDPERAIFMTQHATV
ncbi:hypothetical protein D9757_006877 [Collybiopsis confluens]|uniref:Ubiquitin 3 binding protein But2 C-terminal domain-containing protein n=1 Tax=Collybiopsis confluens TaxID=2823264 RepID=A0A8H5HQB8_9AGAR|nr:hypothetical protein D9757_006877 [Collybiopsis confluens]